VSTATLNGKTAIVTGGGQGMGRTMALGLVRAGVRVAIVDLDDGALRGAAREARGARQDGAFQTIVPVVYDPHSMEKYMNKLAAPVPLSHCHLVDARERRRSTESSRSAVRFTPQQSHALQKPKVRPDVVQWIQAKGIAKVGVQLSGQWELDPELSPDARLAQRQAIANAQQGLIAALVGTRHKVISRSSIGPFLSLEVGPDALAVLEHSQLVKDVYLEEALVRPQLSESVPHIGGNQAWVGGFDGTGQVVVVIDTGVDGNHPFLTGKVFAEACFSSGGNCPNGETSQTGSGAGVHCTYAPDPLNCWHGTHVAGIVAGQGTAFSGVARGCPSLC